MVDAHVESSDSSDIISLSLVKEFRAIQESNFKSFTEMLLDNFTQRMDGVLIRWMVDLC